MRIAAALACLLLAGCGTMLPGTIYSTDGRSLAFQIEQSRGSGKMSAVDGQTGEVFAGQYSAVLGRRVGVSTTFGADGQARVGTSVSGSNIAPASGFLKGDKGTMLTCDMEIAAGFSPHGIGECQDNAGKRFKLQF